MIEIKTITAEQVLPIRHQVLWPHFPPEHSKVTGDEDALHVGAYKDQKLVCVASVFREGNSARLRKFATLPSYQGVGIGSQVIEHILTIVKQEGGETFWCDARESAFGFYQRFGMTTIGETFYKEDIPYKKMSVALSSRSD
ncbi:Acetyltransferase (GNAT) domain-containing protein [Vibrio hangzhouensis]|uniref:Acetyltransferase (GNAT) domain-containing protein n=1 Tax=Vibrio hangzhouensis TaxID=462991 RepID=A0A1H5YGM6_9VIBR|nr:Acetyltransferase (GNAT) domain-containing protein [Vibrio hangzhouensis]